MVLSRVFYAILGIFLLLVLYMVYFQGVDSWRWGVIPLVLLGIMNYMFQPQIDYWWFERSDAKLDPIEHHFLENHLYFYKVLPKEVQVEFGRDCIRFNHHVEYILQGIPSFPEDLKVMVAAHALSLKYGLDLQTENPFQHFERIAFYPHPFISPDIDQVHASESHFEDGVWIFSLEQFLSGINQPQRYFNICLYEMAKVLISENDEVRSELDGYSEEDLEAFRSKFSNIKMERIRQWINLDEIDVQAAYLSTLIVHWEEVSALSTEELHKLPLGSLLKYLDILKRRLSDV